MVESFFSSLKKKYYGKRRYKTRELARENIFDDIEILWSGRIVGVLILMRGCCATYFPFYQN
ncbi:ISEc14 transposase B [Edwardsiella anguillarum]|nr:ISEc14 transposase B [Edwardsiella anguillarum]BET83305.1 ISEc14 transposase B [Edwardsiella anguillarum]BET86672.1 ISEc14 transposase B [Edwardsiella anguillarum]BET90098.1 ISEc14 transposase B [Edwardsiella anguillarum]GAJ66687.1 ISEc14 transposase B [Edwardsiella piscicida]